MWEDEPPEPETESKENEQEQFFQEGKHQILSPEPQSMPEDDANMLPRAPKQDLESVNTDSSEEVPSKQMKIPRNRIRNNHRRNQNKNKRHQEDGKPPRVYPSLNE